jgi:transposase
MTQYKRIGIDTSTAVFTLHGVDQHDRPVLRINLRRAQMTTFFKKPPQTEIAMEACGGAHHWARVLTALRCCPNAGAGAARGLYIQRRQSWVP